MGVVADWYWSEISKGEGMNNLSVACVVVTYNRKATLEKCLSNLMNQTYKNNKIVVVNNGSNDGTIEMLQENKYASIHIINLKTNLGGAGGFHYGLKFAEENGFDWAWIMDDDAYALPEALESLMLYADANEDNILCSTLINSEANTKSSKTFLKEVNDTLFVGFAISSKTIKKIGLPIKDLFIYWDDVEYCNRAKKSGSKIFQVIGSEIVHADWSKRDLMVKNILGKRITYASMPGWRAYYVVRNRILIVNSYDNKFRIESLKHVAKTLIKSLLFQRDNVGFIIRAIVDGILNRKGKIVSP